MIFGSFSPAMVALALLVSLALPLQGHAQSSKKKTSAPKPTLQECLTWLQSLPETKGGALQGAASDRFKKMTVEDLKILKSITLGGHLVTDLKTHITINADDFKYLTALPALEEARLVEINGFTDAALAHVFRIDTLTKFTLWDADITDAGLRDIVNLKKLVFLDLFCPKYGDAGLVPIGKLTDLETLHLGGTKSISDAGLPSLQKLAKLKELKLPGRSTVTQNGIAGLQRALPNCAITKN